jgi:hypothetical protein
VHGVDTDRGGAARDLGAHPPTAPASLPFDESFFDVGGHSILATRLIFEIRKAFVVNAPIGPMFERPTIREQAARVDALWHGDLGLAFKEGDAAADWTGLAVPDGAYVAAAVAASASAVEYARDFESLAAGASIVFRALSSRPCSHRVCLQVHWVYPYDRPQAANVLSTLAAIELAATAKPKHIVFVRLRQRSKACIT